MSNVADGAKAAANGQAIGFLPGGSIVGVDDGILDDDLVVAGVRARGYWESVWLRLKRDKLAIAGGVFIVLLFVVAFVGAPVASKLLGHGPNEPFLVSGGLDSEQLPAGPWTHVGKLQDDGSVTQQLFAAGLTPLVGGPMVDASMLVELDVDKPS